MKFYPSKFFKILILFFILIFFLYIFFQRTKPKEIQNLQTFPTPTIFNPSSKEVIINPPDTKTFPTLPLDKGGGIDIDSQLVKDSQQEIEKLKTFLPYQTTYKLSTKIETDVVIPSQTIQPWILTIQFFGIDYRVQPEEENYEVMKKSFKEAVNNVFLWAKDHNVDLNKVLINWGDKSYIQDSAEKWLKEL